MKINRALSGPVLGVLVAIAAAPAALTGFLATPAAAQQADLAAVDFRPALEPYGQWVSHQRWREVWVPNMPAGLAALHQRQVGLHRGMGLVLGRRRGVGLDSLPLRALG